VSDLRSRTLRYLVPDPPSEGSVTGSNRTLMEGDWMVSAASMVRPRSL